MGIFNFRIGGPNDGKTHCIKIYNNFFLGKKALCCAGNAYLR